MNIEDHHQLPRDHGGNALISNDDAFSRSRADLHLEAAVGALEEQWGTQPELLPDEPESPSESVSEQPPRSIPPEASQALESLRSLGVDQWKAEQLIKQHSEALILQTIEMLRYRTENVRSPAAWVIREIERGGYSVPPARLREETKKTKQAAQDLQKQLEEQRLAEEERLRADRIRSFQGLSAERQLELVNQARAQLRRISPKMADAPLDLERPGPLLALLFELMDGLELNPVLKCSSLTPRSGGWDRRRVQAQSALSSP